MRVICIDGVKLPSTKSNRFGVVKNTEVKDLIFEGEIYTVLTTHKKDGMSYYQLAERGYNICYNVKRFAPLSDLDETIIHADKIKEDSYV